jgi:hypothetical protein
MLGAIAMDITYKIAEPFGAVPEGWKYKIEDTDTNTHAWKALCDDFAATMERTLGVGPDDFEFPDWHYEKMSVYAYLYSRTFYHSRFICDVIEILRRHGCCFARFECYDVSKALGNVMIFTDGRVKLCRTAVQTGLATSLGYECTPST